MRQQLLPTLLGIIVLFLAFAAFVIIQPDEVFSAANYETITELPFR